VEGGGGAELGGDVGGGGVVLEEGEGLRGDLVGAAPGRLLSVGLGRLLVVVRLGERGGEVVPETLPLLPLTARSRSAT